ncbi:CU044_5270 family protein [Streptosporangium sp. NPDC051022]|uniref:CU044_5270 family protein n=1 Tax=Streptosporangium sp. NPDC051022 TaxID=3155752 RepID=UPI0034338E28
MNEFRLIDAVMPDVPPPGPGEVADVRRRILDGRRHRRAPLGVLSSGWGRGLVIAAATVAVIGVAVVVPHTGGGTITTVTRTDAEVLDAAADRLAQRRESEGRYWRREMEQVYRQRLGSESSGYFIENRTRDVLWEGEGLRRVTEVRDLGTRPLTDTDAERWREVGSPRLCRADTDCANDMPPSGKTLYSPDAPGVFEQAPMKLGVKEIRELPRDTEELKTRLLSYWPAVQAEMQERAERTWDQERLPSRDNWLWGVGQRLLLDAPTTPGTRAALYRMLAGLPGARVVDGIRDAEGRTGVAVLWAEKGSAESQLVIDRATGELLAVQNVLPTFVPGAPEIPRGIAYHSMLVKKAGWTSDEPAVPKGCAPQTIEKCLR